MNRSCLRIALVMSCFLLAGSNRLFGQEPQWPNEQQQGAEEFDKRFDEFDAAFDVIRQHLTILRRDFMTQPAFAKNANRRGEQMFRAVYSMDRDGKNVQLLVGGPGMIASTDPQLSHDGKTLMFSGTAAIDAVTQSKNFAYALEGPFKGMFRDMGYGNTPDWSPDDKQIAYMINDGSPINAQGGVWVMNADGSNRQWLARGWFPRWSPDGKQLICHGWREDGDATLALIDVAAKKSRTLLNAPGWTLKLYGGSWSPDGKKIVFCGNFEGKDRLATIAADGADDSIEILYTNEENNRQLLGPPAWSPEGKQILLVKQTTDNVPRRWFGSHLYSLALEPQAKPVLLEGKQIGNINRAMSFSPDGKQIFFSSER